jgi:hypothetical protein
MEPLQTVDVDRAVVHPERMWNRRDSRRSLDVKRELVERIEYVVHCRTVLPHVFEAIHPPIDSLPKDPR